MNTFTIYNLESGEILYSTTTEATIDELGIQDGEAILEGCYQTNEHKIINGKAVALDLDFWDMVRSERDLLLYACDWTQLADVVMTAKQKKAWSKYRQDLRDLPKNQSDKLTYEDIDFPPSP